MKLMKVKLPDGSVVSIPLGKGADGKSAYEYAREGGYAGTEKNFIQALAMLDPSDYAKAENHYNKNESDERYVQATIYEQDKTATNRAIADKLSTSTYNTDKSTMTTEIGKKVDQTTYDAEKVKFVNTDNAELWTFTLEDGTEVKKVVALVPIAG